MTLRSVNSRASRGASEASERKLDREFKGQIARLIGTELSEGRGAEIDEPAGWKGGIKAKVVLRGQGEAAGALFDAKVSWDFGEAVDGKRHLIVQNFHSEGSTFYDLGIIVPDQEAGLTLSSAMGAVPKAATTDTMRGARRQRELRDGKSAARELFSGIDERDQWMDDLANRISRARGNG